MIKKTLLASTLVMVSLGLVACSNSKPSTENKTTSSVSSSKKQSSSETISSNKEYRTKFDKIKVGELSQNGAGGSTLKEVEAMLGKPESTTSAKVATYKVKSETWNKDGVTIVAQTIDNKVVSKNITGFKWSVNRPEKLTLKAFNSLKDGESYTTITNKFGEPDSLNESLMLGKKNTVATWLTGVKGTSAVLTFDNDKLTSKTQTDLK